MKLFLTASRKLMGVIGLILIAAFAVSPVSARQLGEVPSAPNDPAQFTLYLPVTLKPLDHSISDIEVTQAIQNLSTPVRLIAGRETFVRAYARTVLSSPVSGLNATLKGYRDGTFLGQLGPVTSSAFPESYSISSLRADKNKSFNFQLPKSWAADPGELTVEIVLQAGSLSPDQGQTGAQISKTFTFIHVPALEVVAVPINLITGGYVYPPPDTSFLHDTLMRMYPVPEVNVSIRDSWTFEGNLKNVSSWEALLNQVADLQKTEVGYGSNTVYYAVVPLLDENRYSWFSGSGILGIGYINYRAAVGISDQLDDSSKVNISGKDTASHEIGHNLGRLHTEGCGATSLDYDYPYSNGLIGQYGLRFSDQFVVPNTYNDIMNYCDNQWISDYTYNELLNDQLDTLDNINLPVNESLYLRAEINDDGSVSLLPAYVFPTSPDNKVGQGEYSLQFIGPDGDVISEHPLSVITAQEYELTINSILAALPLPDQSFSSIRLMHKGMEIAQRSFAYESQSARAVNMTAIRADDILTLSWVDVQTPSLVRYSSDGGSTWTTLGIDLTETELQLGLSNLPSGHLIFQVLPADSRVSLTLEYLN